MRKSGEERIIRFGIAGTGSIAMRFCRALQRTQGVLAAAVSSRSEEKGRRFADEAGIERVFVGLDAMAESDDVDVIYVATPHPAHYAMCLRALQGGKHVLCEKPLCVSGEQAQRLFAEAKRRNLFLMEGMWSRFLPNSIRAKTWIREGRIGAVRMIDGMFSFAVDPREPKARLVEPELGGGAMFDLGVYTVEMASWYAGCDPVAWKGLHTPYCPGTDAMSAMVLRYPNGILATVRMGIVCDAPPMMTVYGEKGRIELPGFFAGRIARLYVGGELKEECALDCELPKGFVWEIEAVRDAVLAGKTESDVVPAATSIRTSQILGEMMREFFPDVYGKRLDG